MAEESECLWRRSTALAFAGRSDETAEEALAIATPHPARGLHRRALRGLGIAWEAAGKLDQAEAAFRRAARAAEANSFFAAWASARLGVCLARQGRPRDAERHSAPGLARNLQAP